MSKRNIEKHILMNKAEAQDLQKKAKRVHPADSGIHGSQNRRSR